MPSLLAILGFDTGPFNKGVDAAQAKARSGGKGIESAFGGLGSHLAGFATVGGITAAIHSTIEYGSKINDLSLRLGMSTDDVQKWDYALKQNGSSIDEAVPFFEKLGKARLRALAGSEDDIKAFQKFGIGMDAVKGNVSDIGLAISDVYKAGGDPQQLIGAMTQLGGKGAEAMVAAMRDGLRNAFAEAPVISPADIEKLDEMGDKLSRLQAEWQAVLAPALVSIGNGLLRALEIASVGLSVVVGALMGAADSLTSKVIPQLATWSTLINPVGAAAKAITLLASGATAGAGELGDSAMEVNKRNKLKRDEEDAARKANRAKKEKAFEAARAAAVESESDEKKKERAAKQKHEAKEAERLSEKIHANDLAAMTTAKRLNALHEDRAALVKSLPTIGTKEGQLEAEMKIADIDKELIAARKKAAGEMGKHSVNSLQQSGAFFGNYASAGTTLAPEMAALNVQTKSEQHLAKIVALLSKQQEEDEASGQGLYF